jgi:hypothetical protein
VKITVPYSAHIEDNLIFSAALKGQWREMLVAYSIQSRIEIKDPKLFVRWFEQKTISYDVVSKNLKNFFFRISIFGDNHTFRVEIAV